MLCQSFCFFNSSRLASKQVTEVFDFLWPTALALWNMRWEVTGFLQVVPNATKTDLDHRFVVGSGIRGVNFPRAFVEKTWEEHQETLARMLLINLCSLYESWIQQVLLELGIQNRSYEKGLQFPTAVNKGIQPTLQKINSPHSPLLKAAFYSDLIKNKYNSLSSLEELMVIYRYFKECRNCIIHADGITNKELEAASRDITTLDASGRVPLPEFPKHFDLKIGEPVILALRGVVGLSNIVLRLIATLDAELAYSKKAEDAFVANWKRLHGKRHYVLKSRDKAKRKAQVSRLVKKMALPEPQNLNQFEKFMLQRNLVS